MTASNTHECFEKCIGKMVVGVLFDALPWSRTDLAKGTMTLVFDDGSGLTIAANGSYWLEPADDITRACNRKARELEKTKRDLRGVLRLAGKKP